MLLGDKKLLRVNKEIVLSKDTVEAIEQFAYGVNTEQYNQRGQSNPKKKIKDQMAGKISEWGVFLFLRENGYEPSEPDMKIYARNKKNFNPDLLVDNLPVHCKSCHADSKYPKSWIFQKSDSYRLSGKDKEFYDKTKGGILIVGTVDHKKKSVTIEWALDKNYAIDFLKPPMLLQLKNIKDCLYNSTLEEIYNKLENTEKDD